MRDAIISFPALGITIDPPAGIDIFGHTIYLYGIVIALGFLLAMVYCTKRAPQFGLTEDNIYDVVLWALPIGLVGARAYYVFFNYSKEFAGRPFVDVFKIWNGGIAIYGGIIAGILAAIVLCRKKHISLPAFLDIGSYGLLIGQMCGRWGNFFNREAFGSETELFTRMGLTTSTGTIYVHPTFLYESVWNLIGFTLLHIYSKKCKRKFDGEIFLMYVTWYGIGRCMIEGLRTDSLYIGSTGIRVSQLLAGVSAVVALGCLLYFRRHPKPLLVDRVAHEGESTSET